MRNYTAEVSRWKNTCGAGKLAPRFSQPGPGIGYRRTTIGDWRLVADVFLFQGAVLTHGVLTSTQRQLLHEGGRSGDIRSCQGRKDEPDLWSLFVKWIAGFGRNAAIF